MLHRDTLVREHAQLSGLIDELVELCRANVPATAELVRKRWHINRVLTLHLAKEDKLLYPALERSGNAATRLVAAQFIREWGGHAIDLVTWMTDWPADRIERDWAGFRAATDRQIKRLRRRIEREEALLYPYIDAA